MRIMVNLKAKMVSFSLNWNRKKKNVILIYFDIDSMDEMKRNDFERTIVSECKCTNQTEQNEGQMKFEIKSNERSNFQRST